MDGCKNAWGLYKQSKYKILKDFDIIDVQRFLLHFSSLKELGIQIPLQLLLAGYLWALQLKFEDIVFLGGAVLVLLLVLF